MQSPKTVRERLIGKDLIGFDTRSFVRAPRVKAGEGVERAPRAKVCGEGATRAPRAKVGGEGIGRGESRP